LIAAIVTRALLAGASQRFQVDLAQPLPVAGGWGRLGLAVFDYGSQDGMPPPEASEAPAREAVEHRACA